MKDEFTRELEGWVKLLNRREMRNSWKKYYYMDVEVPTIDGEDKKIRESPYKIYLLNMGRFLMAVRLIYSLRIITRNPFIGITKNFMIDLPVDIIHFFNSNNIDIGYWIYLHLNQ